ncbi:MAG: hypothetical protein JWO02_149, partial [Solirubrobacterales bacterium]|nr:hypothetical protein [Solirubrobacterales bacterium]
GAAQPPAGAAPAPGKSAESLHDFLLGP